MARTGSVLTPRDIIFSRIKAALGRAPGDPAEQPPAVRLTDFPREDPVATFSDALSALGGTVIKAPDLAEAHRQLETMLAGKRVVASRAPILGGLGEEYSRDACAAADIGLTSADFALADTGTLVFLTESQESRLISLLPPCHIAVIERDKILSSLDELVSRVPHPGVQSSAMVLITGPSRTADIEMRLVRGVHGPGEIVVIIIET
jgi:L-lactate dehydrogenase complex protein LldG